MSSWFTDPERRKGFPRPGDWWVAEPRGESGSKEPWLQSQGSSCSLGSSPFTSSTQSTQWALVGRQVTWAPLTQKIAPSQAPHCLHLQGKVILLQSPERWPLQLSGLGASGWFTPAVSHCRGNQPKAGSLLPPWRWQWRDSCEGMPWPQNWLPPGSWRPQAGFKSCL